MSLLLKPTIHHYCANVVVEFKVDCRASLMDCLTWWEKAGVSLFRATLMRRRFGLSLRNGREKALSRISCLSGPRIKREQVLPAPFVFPFLCFPPPTNFGDKALFFSPFGLRCHFHFLFFVFTDISPASLFSERPVDVCQEGIEGHSLFQRDPESKNEGAK